MPVGVGGCPWRVPSVKGPSWGFWRGAVKNDRNFSGGYAYAVAAQFPHGPPPGQESRHPPPPLSNPLASPVTARGLGSCVPAKTTGTLAIVGHMTPYHG